MQNFSPSIVAEIMSYYNNDEPMNINADINEVMEYYPEYQEEQYENINQIFDYNYEIQPEQPEHEIETALTINDSYVEQEDQEMNNNNPWNPFDDERILLIPNFIHQSRNDSPIRSGNITPSYHAQSIINPRSRRNSPSPPRSRLGFEDSYDMEDIHFDQQSDSEDFDYFRNSQQNPNYDSPVPIRRNRIESPLRRNQEFNMSNIQPRRLNFK